MSRKYQLINNERYGFKQISPTPSNEEIAQYYKDEFYSTRYESVNNSSLEYNERDKSFNDSKRDDVFEIFCNYFKTKNLSGLSCFDIGCGWGYFLSYFKQKGMIGVGCEPCEQAVEYGRNQGLDIINSNGIDIQDLELEKQFDVVSLMNVLEHVSDPVNTIKVIKESIIKDEGLLLIEVPNDFNVFQEAAVKAHQLEKWWVQPPAHLNYFTRDSLSNLLTSFDFEIVHTTASFPLELFLLLGDNYIGDTELGRRCHDKRVQFETNMKKTGFTKELASFYDKLADLNLGRTVQMFARAK
jgi:2-polyprenyl-3-methyl-5-hydroxy-6-metoxy-1,4-benzoquinol methylase